MRGTGVHAAGIIIAPATSRTSSRSAPARTAAADHPVRRAGDRGRRGDQMDFLGLKTLTIIRDALRMIQANHGVEIDIDAIPLDDAKTLALYQRAETNGTFQFESAGMQKYLRELKPDQFADLIAMNALYRPGPLEYIPNFIKRKHGQERPSCTTCRMENTSTRPRHHRVPGTGDVAQLKLAGFNKGDADVLRKAMGRRTAPRWTR